MNKRYCAPIRISNIDIILQNSGSVKAFANVTFNGLIVIKGFRVVEGPDGYYVGMPNIRKKDGSYASVIYLEQMWLKDLIEDVVIDAYAVKTGAEFEIMELNPESVELDSNTDKSIEGV